MSTIQEDCAHLRGLKLKANNLDAQAKDAKAEHVAAELALFARMDEESTESIKYDGTLFVPASTVYGQVQDRGEFVAWAEENQPELLEVKERKSLVNELIRSHLDDGAELPPGLGFYVREYVSQRVG